TERLPGAADARRQAAVRIDRSGGRVDWSLSWFSGFDLTPDAAVVTAAGSPRVELRYHRIQVLGADAATVVGRYGLRAEAAWTRTADRTGRDPEVKNGTVFAVLGADRTFGPSFNVNLQYVIRVVTGFTPAEEVADPVRRQAALALMTISGQRQAVQQGATLRLSDQWLHETLKAEIQALAFAAPRQYLVRLRARYAVTDRWELVVGADRMGGEAGTLFRTLHRNSLVFSELRYGL
ncbi:MAG TPA: hypothetical protein VNH46_03655, partial [Gemmatimonadales bacterium]|nr:hypothetical protein [Gemmatimonadales bacterium]